MVCRVPMVTLEMSGSAASQDLMETRYSCLVRHKSSSLLFVGHKSIIISRGMLDALEELVHLETLDLLDHG